MASIKTTSGSTTFTIHPLVRDLLVWLDGAPRTYSEVMEAWRSSCPRLTIWEDALADGLVRVERASGVPMGESGVVLTDRGHAALASADRA